MLKIRKPLSPKPLSPAGPWRWRFRRFRIRRQADSSNRCQFISQVSVSVCRITATPILRPGDTGEGLVRSFARRSFVHRSFARRSFARRSSIFDRRATSERATIVDVELRSSIVRSSTVRSPMSRSSIDRSRHRGNAISDPRRGSEIAMSRSRAISPLLSSPLFSSPLLFLRARGA